MSKTELVLNAGAVLGEGPIWDYDRKLLYWIDIISKEVHVYNPETCTDRVIKTDQMIGTVVLRESEGLVLAMEKGFYFLDEESEEVSFITDPESDIQGNRFNDGKCDPAGRLWAGTMSLNNENGTASLYCLDTKLNVTKKLDGVSISNGITWSPNEEKMYYIDTPAREVWRFDYEVKTGSISNKTAVVFIPEDEGFPDGMTIDSEGMIWVAHWDGWRVSRWNPETGKKLTEVKLPVSQVTACAFGGKNLDELYVTTASVGLSEDKLAQQPYAGGLFRINTGAKGLPSYKFRG